MGGKSTAIVDKDCDIDLAASEIIASFCRASGQRPDAIARIIVVADMLPPLFSSMKEKIETMRIGHGAGNHIDMGPLISESVQKRYLRFGSSLSNFGHKSLIGVSTIGVEDVNGFYVRPAIYEIDWKGKDIIGDVEPTGPIAMLYPVESFSEGAALHNRFAFRKMCSVFSTRPEKIKNTFIDSGAIGLNRALKEDSNHYCGRGRSSNGASTGIGTLFDLTNRRNIINYCS